MPFLTMLSMQISSYYRLKGENLWFDEVDANCEKFRRTVYTQSFNQVRLKRTCHLLHTDSLCCKTYLARALPRRVLEEFFELAKSRL